MRLPNIFRLTALSLPLFFMNAGWAQNIAKEKASFTTVNLDSSVPLDKLAGVLASKRVVFIGESHDRYDHHLNQLEIIRRLHQLDPDFAIGVEYLQQPFQAHVDDYIAGRITEDEFLRRTEYYKGWGYDYRLYAPIFRFAREQQIPVRALNVPTAVASASAKSGIAGLTPEQRAYLPEKIEPADEGYKGRLREAFEGHGSAKPGAFDHFVEAQLTWDEGMATSAAKYLNAHPGRHMVILAGAGHIAFGSGIPSRLERQTHASYAIVLNSGEELEPRMADYVLLSKKVDLPPAGVLGISLEEDKKGEEGGHPSIRSLSPGSAAEKAGLRKGDTIFQVDGQTVHSIADLRLALWEKKPGDRVQLSVGRGRHPKAAAAHTVRVELAAAGKSGPG